MDSGGDAMKGLTICQQLIPAWLEGRMTVTRRLMNPQPIFEHKGDCTYGTGKHWKHYATEAHFRKGAAKDFAKYKPGETVYIKETWAHFFDKNPAGKVFYKATDPDFSDAEKAMGWKWKSPRFMPQWVARSHALIGNVKPEQLEEMTETEARLEGFQSLSDFVAGWVLIHGVYVPRTWIWRIELEKKDG
jgi:hypothetical protein